MAMVTLMPVGMGMMARGDDMSLVGRGRRRFVDGSVMVVGAGELAALALGWGRANWLEVMPPMAIVMAHHAKNGPQDAPGGGRCRSIGRGDAPTLTLPRRGRGFIGVRLPPALWGWGRGMLPMKECLGLAGDAPTLTLPHSASALPPAGAHWPQGVVMTMAMVMAV